MKDEDSNLNTTDSYSRSDKNRGLVAGLFVALAIVVIVGAIAVAGANRKTRQTASQLETQKHEMATQLNQRDSIINDWVMAFNEIESNIKKITERENMLSLQSMNPEITADKKQEIMKEIELIRGLIDQNKKKLSSLNAKLRDSGIKMAGLQSRVDTLEANIVQKDKDMAAMKMELVDKNFEIGQLNEKVDTMKNVVADQNTKISQQTEEINKAYVVSGTYKDLKEKGLLVKEGGVLGLGKIKSLQANFGNDNLFTKVDITQTHTIAVNSKSARLITEHPANSYELVKDKENADKIAYIEIKDPASFWKISKYAVVEVQ